MTLNWILGWWNVIYMIPFFVALLYLGLYAATGLTFGDADVDSDLELDHDLDVDHDVDVDQDVDVENSLPSSGLVASATQSDAQIHEGTSTVGVSSILYWLGVGKIPISLILMVLGLTWGAVGFATNNVTRNLFSQDWMVALVSLPVAFAISTWSTRTLSRVMARYMPSTQTSARPKQDLIGTVGEAVLPIDTNFGLVAVRDRHQLHQLSCRLARGDGPLPKGAKVLLIDFDAGRNLFDVVAYDAN